jgi:8-oxo-dGTP pyrophosphatase MutT (NUDIX family)
VLQVAVVFVRDSRGRYLVHRRAASRRLYPGRFGLGAGGKVEPGERELDAAARELREETGFTASPSHRFSFDFKDGEYAHRVHLFEASADGEPRWDTREWDFAGWMSEPEVDSLLEQGSLCPDTEIAYRRFRAGL